MITRIEIDGFKSFEEFSLDLEPFTVLAGPNNSGKSNLLEAINLVKELFSGNERALVNANRGAGSQLFHRADDGTERYRFNIRIHREDSLSTLGVTVGSSGPGRGFEVIVSDDLAVARGERTRSSDQLPDFTQWVTVSPIPDRMRLGASMSDALPLAADGRNLAAVIARIIESESFPQFELDAAHVIGELTDVRSIQDDRRQQWDIDLVMRGKRVFTPALVSDGTLRILAILAAIHDPAYAELVLVEELENGLDPRFVGRLVDRILTRTAETEGLQVIATTHSPVVLSAMKERSPESVYLLGLAGGPGEFDGVRKLRRRTHARSAVKGGERGTYVPSVEFEQYLSPVKGD